MAGIEYWAIPVIAAYAYAAVLAVWLACRSAFAFIARQVFRGEPEISEWQCKQVLASPSRYYGDGGTIHSNGYLDVELDYAGNVVAVWFRCQMLPFKQADVSNDRADDMERAYSESHIPALTGVEVLDR